MQLNLSALVTLLGFSLGAQALSGYTATCNSGHIQPPAAVADYWDLIANCRKPSGAYHVQAAIRLGDCLGNSGGNLFYQRK
ncbi:uncharacterized protein LTR77_004647 [Saxophila tyrrhenica]|uniref:Cyanovirin-N domain-containing protein n=1 Tax=Saxophila tyrrhenica TaxID=1690608 RepID=A0AAV9PGA1_9PEZI|nr:hypothetical protein LTR77_004647 [Saxophila tyrrhenica]